MLSATLTMVRSPLGISTSASEEEEEEEDGGLIFLGFGGIGGLCEVFLASLYLLLLFDSFALAAAAAMEGAAAAAVAAAMASAMGVCGSAGILAKAEDDEDELKFPTFKLTVFESMGIV